jgi:homoserine kinase
MTAATAFAPATVSNVACGFDVLGFALDAPGDEVTAAFTTGTGVHIADITGDGGRLPRDAARNTAGVAAQSLLTALGERRGIALRIAKGLPLSSGLGGSAASAVAAVVAVDALIGALSPAERLIACALDGERLGAGSSHADNVAPCVCGGLVLVRTPSPPDIIRLPVPEGLTAVVVHPDLEIETARARTLLGTTVPLGDAVKQWANLGALVHGLHVGDTALISRALEDAIAEPRRASLIPGLAAIKKAAVDAGALGSSISGSGPSLFALCMGAETARQVAAAMGAAVTREIGGHYQTYISPVTNRGARVVTTCAS